jgi:hypothetical protein
VRISRLVQAALLASAGAACGLSVVGSAGSSDAGPADAASERRSSSSSSSGSPDEDDASSTDADVVRDPPGADAASTDAASAASDAGVDAPAPVPDAGVPCPELDSGIAARHTNGHCYFLYSKGGEVTQPEALGGCAAAGAHLVTVTSEGERTFLASVGGSDYRWIGLVQPNTTNDPGQFHWYNGETPVDQTQWVAGNPNDNARCAILSPAGHWADNDCDNEYPALCERE